MLVAAGLITVSNRTLLLSSGRFVLGFIALFLTTEYDTNWDWTTMTHHGLWKPKNVVRNLFFDGFRSVFPWTGMLVFGMWLGRRELRERATNIRFLIEAGATILAAEFVSAIAVVLSWVWKQWFRHGPLEWLMRIVAG